MLRVNLVCVGRLKAGPESDLVERYLARANLAGRGAGLAFDVREIDESRGRRAEDRKVEEAKAILASLPPGGRLLAFDEAGEAIGSAAFAALVGSARDDGLQVLALLLGGPDGLDPAVRGAAHGSLAFGAMTWPHQLARIMAAEQCYRAVTILTRHPYHRA